MNGVLFKLYNIKINLSEGTKLSKFNIFVMFLLKL